MELSGAPSLWSTVALPVATRRRSSSASITTATGLSDVEETLKMPGRSSHGRYGMACGHNCKEHLHLRTVLIPRITYDLQSVAVLARIKKS